MSPTSRPNTPKQPMEECSPGSNCVFAGEVLQELRSDVREIKTAMVGNEEMGQIGIAKRQAMVEKDVAELKAEALQARTSLRIIAAVSVFLASAISMVAGLWFKAKQ